MKCKYYFLIPFLMVSIGCSNVSDSPQTEQQIHKSSESWIKVNVEEALKNKGAWTWLLQENVDKFVEYKVPNGSIVNFSFCYIESYKDMTVYKTMLLLNGEVYDIEMPVFASLYQSTKDSNNVAFEFPLYVVGEITKYIKKYFIVMYNPHKGYQAYWSDTIYWDYGLLEYQINNKK